MTGKRLFRYALLYKKIILWALFLLTISVVADLAGPFVAKKVIDQHILGIQSHWYESSEGDDAVSYKGKWYIREDYATSNDKDQKQVSIVQDGLNFLFVEEAIAFEGKMTYENSKLTMKNEGEQRVYPAQILSKKQVLKFYQPEVPRIIKLVAFYFGLIVIAAFFQYWQSYYLQKSANRIIQRMRNDLFEHLSTLPIRFFDHIPAGKIVSRVTNDTESIKELYVHVLANFFSSTIYIVGIYAALFILNVKLAVLCLIFIPILIAWTFIYRKFASKYNKVIQARISDINGMVNESIQGMNIIQAFGREKDIETEFSTLNDEHYSYQKKMLRLNSLTSFNLVNVLVNLAFLSFIVYFGNVSLNSEGALSIGMLYAFIDYLNRLFRPIQNIVNQFANLEQALVAGGRVFELLDEVGTKVRIEEIERYKGEVEFKDVSFGYKKGKYVLKEITFSAKQGETVAFVGHTGSGKSSIMNLLFRYYDTDKGTITIDGKEITGISRQSLRKHMAIVLQDPYLFTGTIASNVSLNEEGITRDDIEKALQDVGADLALNQVEGGIDAPVIEKGNTLSAGQRQLISFARALAFKPSILILDEATSNIDTETEFIIQQALEVLKKGRTTFIIAHRLSTILSADNIIVLDKGRIVEQGTHDELMLLGGKYCNMYQMQIGKGSGLVI